MSETQSQCQRLLELMSDGRSHRMDEMIKYVYGEGYGIHITARISNLRKKGYDIRKIGRDRDVPSLYYYKLYTEPVQEKLI